jgi:methionyl-tRNA synthetase
MSKSRGNIVRSETILEVLGADALRYFLMREIVFGQDGSFSFDALVQRFNSDLANGLGNLASRTLSMITRYFKGEVPYPSAAVARQPVDDVIIKHATEAIQQFTQQWNDYQFSRALETAWTLVSDVDKYIVENQPWAVADKDDENSRSRLATILYTSAEALRIVTALVHPVLPDSTSKIWMQMGLGDIAKFKLKDLKWGQLELGTKLNKVEGVFPRADKTMIERMQQMEQERAQAAAAGTDTQTNEPAGTGAQAGQPATQAAAVAPAQGATPPPATDTPAIGTPEADAAPAVPSPYHAPLPTITIDDFAKIDLRVAHVLVAEPVKGADKLLRLEVDLGYEKRQILAGIAQLYKPEQLVGRKIIIVANLAPRKMRGLESQGMLLAASLGEGGTPVLAGFLEDVPPGAKLK